jgi:tRNA (adenine37-N6)-methyltransferase
MRKEDNLLEVIGVDVLDGTPLLHIKPYIPDFDHHPVTRIGWYQNRKYE